MPAYGPKSSVLEHQPKGVTIIWKGETPSNKYPSSSMFVFYVWRVCIRPAEFFEGFRFQTPPLNLTQNLIAYQFLGP